MIWFFSQEFLDRYHKGLVGSNYACILIFAWRSGRGWGRGPPTSLPTASGLRWDGGPPTSVAFPGQQGARRGGGLRAAAGVAAAPRAHGSYHEHARTLDEVAILVLVRPAVQGAQDLVALRRARHERGTLLRPRPLQQALGLVLPPARRLHGGGHMRGLDVQRGDPRGHNGGRPRLLVVAPLQGRARHRQ